MPILRPLLSGRSCQREAYWQGTCKWGFVTVMVRCDVGAMKAVVEAGAAASNAYLCRNLGTPCTSVRRIYGGAVRAGMFAAPQGRSITARAVLSLLTLSVLMILRLSVIEFRPWIVGRDKPTAGPESGYGCGRSEARSATMRPVCYLYSFSRTTLTAWSSTSLAPMLMAWSRQQLQREPIALAAPCVAS